MPKTESELWDWVVEYNRDATHNRGLTSNYGYNAILDVDLVAVCRDLRSRFDGPIRVLDVGCGSGRALAQLSDCLTGAGVDTSEFEFWGMGVNRYPDMFISDDRMLYGGINSYEFAGSQFHLITSVYAFHYFWHKFEALEKIHNELLVENGQAYIHFPGYLIRHGETSADLAQTEAEGNHRFERLLADREETDSICELNYRTIPYYSDDDDRALLGEFGHVRFARNRDTPISFHSTLEAFSMFSKGFSMSRMDNSGRIYIASYYGPTTSEEASSPGVIPTSQPSPQVGGLVPDRSNGAAIYRPAKGSASATYRITTVPVEVNGRVYELDTAVHAEAADSVVIICPGACDSLVGRSFPYRQLARQVVKRQLGAVVRYNDPYDYECDYADFLVEKLRAIIRFTLEDAEHFCGTREPRLRLVAYSSSAGAAAKLTAEYEQIESLLLVAPSYDVPLDSFATDFRRFTGKVHVLIGDSDQRVLPQQAFWYYEQATSAQSREYTEAPCCGHEFAGGVNRSLLLRAPEWAFGEGARPHDFPPAMLQPSEAWT